MTTDKRTLEILIAMGMKPDAVNKTIAEFKKINQQIGIFEKDASNLKKAIEVALSHGEDTSEFKAQLKVVEDAMSRLQNQMDKTNKSAKDLKENSYYLRDIGEKLSQIGMGMQNAGNMLLAPLQGAMQAYMAQQQAIKDAGGTMSASARKYLDAQKQMQEAYIRIGAVAADKLLPVIEVAADALDKFASFIEKNPELVTAIAGMGVTLVAGGKIVSSLGELAKIIGVIQGIGVGSSTSAAGGGLIAGIGSGLTAAAPAIGVLIAGAFTAELVRRGLNKGLGTNQSWSDIGTTGKQALAISAMGWVKIAEQFGITLKQGDAKTWQAIKNFVGLGDAVEEAGKKAETTEQQLANLQFGKAYQQYQAETKQAEVEYYTQREKIMTDAQSAELNAQRSYQASLASINECYKQLCACRKCPHLPAR